MNSVLVPVVVRDKQGHSVGNLKNEDFQVFEEKKPHAISGFTVLQRGIAETGSAQQQQTSANSAPNPPVSPRRFFVFLFDDLHLSPEDLTLSRQAGAKAVTEILTDSDIAAVVSTSGQTNSGLAQDRAKLQAAIMNLRPSSRYRSSYIGCPYFDYYLSNLAVNLHDIQAITEANNEASCMPSVGGQMGDQPQTIAQMAEQAATSQQQAAPSQEVEQLSGKAMAKAMYELERSQTAVRETYAIMGEWRAKWPTCPDSAR